MFLATILTFITFFSIDASANFEQKFDLNLPYQETSDTAIENLTIINKNCLVSCPIGTSLTNIMVDHDAIVLSSNKETKFADWVAYLSKTDYMHGPKRDRNWAKDPKIDKEYTFIPRDYQGMSVEPFLFDRGHQAPLASFKNHPKWFVVNYLSNITPQKKYLNQGPWQRLETAERDLVEEHGEAFVMTGPYYNEKEIVKGPSIKRIGYIVPSGYWKIIAIQEEGKIWTVAFSFSQSASRSDNYCKAIVPLSKIEESTGLKFFGNNPVSESYILKKDIGCDDTLEEDES